MGGGERVYAVCHQTDVERWRCIEGTADKSLVEKATILGTGYTWDNIEKSQTKRVPTMENRPTCFPCGWVVGICLVSNEYLVKGSRFPKLSTVLFT